MQQRSLQFFRFSDYVFLSFSLYIFSSTFWLTEYTRTYMYNAQVLSCDGIQMHSYRGNTGRTRPLE